MGVSVRVSVGDSEGYNNCTAVGRWEGVPVIACDDEENEGMLDGRAVRIL